MTHRQLAVLLRSCRGDLRNTREGYVTHPNGPNWRKAMDKLNRAIAALEVPAVPNLGPIRPDGLSVLLLALTHDTDGADGVWPALDDTNVRVGTPVLAPEACTVIDHTGSDGGVGFKVRGSSKIVHWFLHCATRPALGARYTKGSRLSTVAKIRADQGGPHIHYAVDTRPLVRAWLLYGGQTKPSDRPKDYTFGSPTIGAQLTKMLSGV